MKYLLTFEFFKHRNPNAQDILSLPTSLKNQMVIIKQIIMCKILVLYPRQ